MRYHRKDSIIATQVFKLGDHPIIKEAIYTIILPEHRSFGIICAENMMDGHIKLIFPGQWLIEHKNHLFEIMNDKDFHEMYQANKYDKCLLCGGYLDQYGQAQCE